MDQVIWKYVLDVRDRQELQMPQGAQILCVQSQNDNVCLWALVVMRIPCVPRFIEIIGTGNPILSGMRTERVYIGSAQTSGGRFMWHVFELTSV